MEASIGMAHVILETDASTVKTTLEGDDYWLPPMGGVITKLKFLTATEFISCSVNVCSRACNKLAHELSSLGYKLPSGDHASWDDVPQLLKGLVSSNYAVTE